MAVICVGAPDTFALSKGGRMYYQFSGAGRVQSTGVRSVNYIVTASVVAPGTVLRLRWAGKDHLLKFVTSPSAPNEFPAGDGSSAYKQQLFEAFKAWQPFREDFIITIDGFVGAIYFLARKAGPAYDFGFQFSLGGLVSPFNVANETKGADPVLRTQYSVYVEVWLQKLGTDGSDIDTHYSRIAQQMIETDSDGAAKFDAGSILHSYLQPDWPVYSIHNPQGAPNSHRQYYILYGEAYGSPMQVGQLSLDTVRHVYLGGADFKTKSAGLELNRFKGGVEENQALRYGSKTRYVRPDEPQFLTFLNQTSADFAELLFRIELTFSDGTQLNKIDTYPLQGLPMGEKIVFPSGPSQLNLAAVTPSGLSLVEYTIQLYLDEVAWSVPYRYILNGAYQPYTRYFVYLNSLGCVETLATYGKGSSELNRFYEQAERYLPQAYAVQEGQFVEYDIALQRSVEVATGFHSQAMLRLWSDFYRSPYRFRLRNNQPLPIGLVSKSIKEGKDGETLFAHLFSYQYQFRDEFYVAEAGDELGDGPPPQGFIPMGGTVSVSMPQIVFATDPSIPNSIRALTDEQIQKMIAAGNLPNPQTLGYLNETSAGAVFRRKDVLISYVNDLTDKPTTRDALGLTDVPTKAEVEQSFSAGLRIPVQDPIPAVNLDELKAGLGFLPVPDAQGNVKWVSFPITYQQIGGKVVSSLSDTDTMALLDKLRPTLDIVLKNGNDSTREQTIAASQRRQLAIVETLEVIQGRVYDPTLSKHVERYQTPDDLAFQLAPRLADILVDLIAEKLGTPQNPGSFNWIFKDLLACEDYWKSYDRTDFSNKDFQ